MTIAARDLEVTFKALDERKGDHLVTPGVPDYVFNMTQNEEGVFEKRDGFSKLGRAADFNFITDAKALMNVGGKLGLATSDSLYTYDTSLVQWTWRDWRRSAFPSYETAMPNHGYMPTMLQDSFGKRWYFSGCTEISAVTGTISRHPTVRVVDSSGVEKLAAMEFDTVALQNAMVPIELAGIIWCFYNANGVIKVAKFNTSTPTTPTITTYYTPPGGAPVIANCDACLLGSSICLQVYGSDLNAANDGIWTSLLNTATGLPAAAPAPVYTGGSNCSAGCLAKNNATSLGHGAVVRGAGLEYFTVSTTLTVSRSTLDAAPPAGTIYRIAGALVGSDTVWFTSTTVDVTLAPQDSFVTRYMRTSGGSITISAFVLGSWLAANPVVIGGRAYVVVGNEDIAQSTTTNPFLADQRSYTLYDVTLSLPIARALYEDGGGDIYNRANFTQTIAGGYSYAFADGNSVVCALNACTDGLSTYSTVRVAFDTAPTDLGPAIPVDDLAYLPGGYPMMLGSWGQLDLAPQFYPDELTLSAVAGGPGTYTGTFGVVATYVFVLPDGREIESQPSEFQSKTCAAEFIRVQCRTLKQLSGSLANFRVYIRFYATTDAGSVLYQQRQVKNDPTTDFVTCDLRGLGVGKILYTEGRVIENTAAPPFRFGCVWGDRVFVSGTPVRGEVWCTKKFVKGKLPQWMDDGKFLLRSSCRAMCPVDQYRLAFFTDSGISVIAGRGPSVLGGDQYEPEYLNEEQTCANPNSVVNCPLGAVFQGRDGGIYLLDTSLKVRFIGRGIDNYKTLTVTSAVHLPKLQQVRLHTGTYTFVWDYGRKASSPVTEADLMGQWYIWSSLEAWTSPPAAIEKDGKHYFVATDGFVWSQVADQAFDGTSSFIGQKMRLPLNFTGISGFMRVLRGVFLGTWVGNHVARVTYEYDGSSTTMADKDLLASGAWDFRPVRAKCANFGLVLEERQYLTSLNKGFKVEGFGFEVQKMPGLKRALTRLG